MVLVKATTTETSERQTAVLRNGDVNKISISHPKMLDRVRLVSLCLLFPELLLASASFAAEAENGKRLAQAHCASCHALDSNQGRQVADAPPFELIAQRFGDNPEILAFSLLDPHPRMNVTLTRREAQDIAAYINTLAK
jgi:mono/diheme cytochrome c family protein